MLITHADMRAFGYCNRTARAFATRHNLDWSDFRKHGIDSAILLATGDAQALRLVEEVNGRQQ